MEVLYVRYRILISDDEVDIVEMLTGFFRSKGYEVFSAYNGVETLKLAELQPDIILLDINMPKLDGIEVCKKIRDYVSCPILFLTARIEENDKVQGFSVGGDDYIVKPFSLVELEARVQAHLRSAQAMLNNPRILILDEPTAGLDPKERVRFRNLISAFSKDRIVILSTHIVSDVEFIAEDIIMMKDGQILHFGKTQEITTEIDGQVWECTVPTSRAEQYSETLNISNLRNIENNCTVLRVISEQSPMENAIKVEPTLEDLYLFYFKGVNE